MSYRPTLGETIVSQASDVFERELRAELRAKFLAIAQADIEHTIEEIVRRMNIHTHTFRHDRHMEWPVTFSYKGKV